MKKGLFVIIACCISLAGTGHVVQGHTINPSVVEKFTGQHVEEETISQSADPRFQERTFASFPEWYIVYNAQEYSSFISNGGTPSQFPYFDSIQQYWYTVLHTQTLIGSSTIDSNTKTVLRVIGVSFSIENGIIGAYEKTIGHLFEILAFSKETNEDRYTEAVAYEYGQFLLHTPWYEFPYGRTLFGLWTTWGWSSFTPRGIERRIAFTVGYAVKGMYGTILGKLSEASLGTADLRTVAAIRGLSVEDLSSIPDVEVVEEKENYISVSAPRYRAFTSVAKAIAERGGQFVDIQGHSIISLSVLADPDAGCLEGLTISFSLPILTHPTLSRVLITTDVPKLQAVILGLTACEIPIEHIYDY